MGDTKSIDIVLNQRLKNRERQRRYRAKKRLEADSTKADTSLTEARAFILEQEAQREELLKQISQVPVNDTSRLYCKRKWKKDARLAHQSKQQPSGYSYLTNSPVGASHESDAPHLLLHLRGESPFESGFNGNNSSSQGETETRTSAPIHRKWKAEARSKIK